MKRQLPLVCLLLLLTTAAWTAPLACATAQMSVYDASGFACTLGAVTFSNFSFSNTNPPPTDVQVTVKPSTDSSGDVTLEFDASFVMAAGSSSSVSIGYTAVSSTPVITGQTLSMTGFGQSGNGTVDIGESICKGGTYNTMGQCSTNNVASMTVFDFSPTNMRTSDSVTFTPALSEVSVMKNIALNGGTTGLNASATVSEGINTVPEPNTIVMLGFGLLSAALVWRKRCQN